MLRIVIVTLVVAVVVLPLLYLAVQAVGVLRKEGGFKAWVEDLSSTNYKLALFLWMGVAFTGIATAVMVLRAAFPSSVGEVQIELVWAIFAFLAAGLGLGTIQFIGKRMTADPQVIAANAAAAGQPIAVQHVETTVAAPDPKAIAGAARDAITEIARPATAAVTLGTGAKNDAMRIEAASSFAPKPVQHSSAQGNVVPRSVVRGLASDEVGE